METKGSSGKEMMEGGDEQTGWDEPIAMHLQALLLENLRMIFRSAIVEITEWGYDEATAQKGLLRRGLYVGSKNPVTTIVNDSLEGLSAKKKATSAVEGTVDGVHRLAEYTLLEMTGVLREVRPFLSAAEAMWWLLICDLNVLQACRLEEELSSGLKCSGCSENHSSELVISQLRAQAQNHVPDPAAFGEFLKRIKPKGSEGEDMSLASMLRNLDSFLGTCGEHAKSRSQAFASGQSSGAGRKGHSKREMTRHLSKSYYIGRTCRAHGSKGLFKSGNAANSGGIAIENKLKTSSGASGVSLKASSSKTNAGLGGKSNLVNENRNASTNTPSTSVGTGNSSKLPGKAITSSLPTEEANNSQKFPSGVKPDLKSPDSAGSPDYYSGIPYDKSSGKYLPQNEKDELILKLVPRLQELQNELQGWTEWANQKVMQATRKLSKIQPELKTMRQVTESAKTFLQENKTKRLAIMENGVNGINSLVEKGKSIICTLEEQNSLLKKELESAKGKALEAAASYQQALEREQKAQKEILSWDGKNGFLQKDLEAEKKELAALQQDLGKEKKNHLKIEARLEREKNETEKLLAEAASIKKEREQLEARAKVEEDSIKHKAKTATQKSLEDIGKLESRFSEAVSRSDSSRVAALKWGATESFGKHLVEAKSFITMTGIQNFEDHFGTKGLRPERECVMCLSEEISVVFVPCSHQVLCEKCNELHRNRGVKDCRSCRTPIQQRIKVRFASP